MTNQEMTDEEFDAKIAEIIEKSEQRVANIVNAYESFLRDEKAVSKLAELIGEIPMINGADNEHKADA
jgi:hypothetical protein